ncbi:MAG: hypothetical protein ACOX50_03065 [Patescibacteria group bacterium]|jgi:hypothetical protein
MLPVATYPLHDKDGSLLAHFEKITPDLKQIYAKVVVSITPATSESQKTRVQTLTQDSFFDLVFNAKDTLPGDHFLAGFRQAVKISDPEQNIHLCTSDRLSFILETEHKARFFEDMAWAEKQDQPVMFQRSPKA